MNFHIYVVEKSCETEVVLEQGIIDLLLVPLVPFLDNIAAIVGI